jgi:hypothetical protein
MVTILTVPLMSQSSDEPPCDTNNTDTAQSQQQSHQVMYCCAFVRFVLFHLLSAATNDYATYCA